MRILIFLLLVCGKVGADPADVDIRLNQHRKLEPAHSLITQIPVSEVDSYWVDSWTADAEGDLWWTPEKYAFVKGDDTVECIFAFVQTAGEYRFIRYDGFYFCGETDWRNYIAYGWADFGTIPPNEPNYTWITGLGYYTDDIPDRLLPVRFDWATRFRTTTHWFHGGFPLSRRPDCFTVTKSR